jgi:hypothetical protein
MFDGLGFRKNEDKEVVTGKEALYEKYKALVPEAVKEGLEGEKLWDVVIDFVLRNELEQED